jgi:hypothetical protein
MAASQQETSLRKVCCTIRIERVMGYPLSLPTMHALSCHCRRDSRPREQAEHQRFPQPPTAAPQSRPTAAAGGMRRGVRLGARTACRGPPCPHLPQGGLGQGACGSGLIGSLGCQCQSVFLLP